jgi:hypothetical protein
MMPKIIAIITPIAARTANTIFTTSHRLTCLSSIALIEIVNCSSLVAKMASFTEAILSMVDLPPIVVPVVMW